MKGKLSAAERAAWERDGPPAWLLPAWIRDDVDPEKMMREMAERVASIEEAREARAAGREADRQAGLEAFERAQRELCGQQAAGRLAVAAGWWADPYAVRIF